MTYGTLVLVYLERIDRVHKGNLLKPFLTKSYSNLPTGVNVIIHHLDRVPSIICFILNVQINVVLEVFNLKTDKVNLNLAK